MLGVGLVQEVVACWGLAAVDVRYPDGGTMNDVVVVSTAHATVVLRGHRRRERDRVDFEHQVMDWASDAGVPVPAALRTPGGERTIERDGQLYSLFEHAPGAQVARPQLEAGHAESMGRRLAELHDALGNVDAACARRTSSGHSYAAALDGIDHLIAVIRSGNVVHDQERWALDRLESRAAWLRDRPEPALPAPHDEQLVHGDFHDGNLFFTDGLVCSVIDWDKAEVGSRGQEAIRAMYLSFGFDPPLCRAFVSGYRAVRDLYDVDLAAGAVGYGHRRDCDLWLYEAAFLRGDLRPLRFITPGCFVPFAELWSPVAATLGIGAAPAR